MKKTNLNNYKYMTNCLNTKREFISKIVAAVHPYDGTCRPQIVNLQTTNSTIILLKVLA